MFTIATTVPVFNVIRYCALTLLLYPLLEHFYHKLLLEMNQPRLGEAFSVRWVEPWWGVWALHSKHTSGRRSAVILAVTGVVFTLTTLGGEFGTDTVLVDRREGTTLVPSISGEHIPHLDKCTLGPSGSYKSNYCSEAILPALEHCVSVELSRSSLSEGIGQDRKRLRLNRIGNSNVKVTRRMHNSSQRRSAVMRVDPLTGSAYNGEVRVSLRVNTIYPRYSVWQGHLHQVANLEVGDVHWYSSASLAGFDHSSQYAPGTYLVECDEWLPLMVTSGNVSGGTVNITVQRVLRQTADRTAYAVGREEVVVVNEREQGITEDSLAEAVRFALIADHCHVRGGRVTCAAWTRSSNCTFRKFSWQMPGNKPRYRNPPQSSTSRNEVLVNASRDSDLESRVSGALKVAPYLYDKTAGSVSTVHKGKMPLQYWSGSDVLVEISPVNLVLEFRPSEDRHKTHYFGRDTSVFELAASGKVVSDETCRMVPVSYRKALMKHLCLAYSYDSSGKALSFSLVSATRIGGVNYPDRIFFESSIERLCPSGVVAGVLHLIRTMDVEMGQSLTAKIQDYAVLHDYLQAACNRINVLTWGDQKTVHLVQPIIRPVLTNLGVLHLLLVLLLPVGLVFTGALLHLLRGRKLCTYKLTDITPGYSGSVIRDTQGYLLDLLQSEAKGDRLCADPPETNRSIVVVKGIVENELCNHVTTGFRSSEVIAKGIMGDDILR